MRFLFGPIVGTAVLLVPGIAAADGVGMRQVTVHPAERAGPLSVGVWYPTDQDGPTGRIGGNAVFRGTPAQVDATVAAGRFPLILLAHGGFRSAPNGAAWLAAGLAARGFVAAVVDPPPLGAKRSAKDIVHELWLRPVDLRQIGAVGFFLGGYTVLPLAGATIDPAAFAASCDDPDRSIDCAYFAARGIDLHQIDKVRLARSNLDPRVRVAIVVDPELTETLDRQSLADIAVPVHVVNLAENGTSAAEAAARIPDASYATIAGASPFDSFPKCTPKGATTLAEDGGDPAICSDGQGRPRTAVHDELASLIETALRQSFAAD